MQDPVTNDLLGALLSVRSAPAGLSRLSSLASRLSSFVSRLPSLVSRQAGRLCWPRRSSAAGDGDRLRAAIKRVWRRVRPLHTALSAGL